MSDSWPIQKKSLIQKARGCHPGNLSREHARRQLMTVIRCLEDHRQDSGIDEVVREVVEAAAGYQLYELVDELDCRGFNAKRFNGHQDEASA